MSTDSSWEVLTCLLFFQVGDLCGTLFLTQLDSGQKAAKNHKYINKVVNGYKDKDPIISPL